MKILYKFIVFFIFIPPVSYATKSSTILSNSNEFKLLYTILGKLKIILESSRGSKQKLSTLSQKNAQPFISDTCFWMH